MCLERITRYKLKNDEKEGEGWKIFEPLGKDDKLRFEYFNLDDDGTRLHPVTRGRWLKAKKKRLKRWSGSSMYTTGFHVYMDEPLITNDADQVKLKVKYRKGRLIGEQDRQRVIVADEIFVPRKGKELK